MHLGIDIREACAAERTGKGQWTYGFVSELLLRETELTLYTDADLPQEWTSHLSARHHVEHIRESGLRWHVVAARKIASSPIDAYVSTVSYIVPALLRGAKPVIPVVHDLIAFRNEPHDRRAVFIERLTLKRATRDAAMICTVSETTKHDLLQRYPRLDALNIVSIFAGPMVVPTAPEKNAQRNIVLSIGTLCPRKNQLRLIEAYASLPPDLRHRFPLVLVGKRGWHDRDIVALAQSTAGVSWRNYLPGSDVESLLQSSVVFAFPSLYEGFGMPILDAFLRNVPVLTSNAGSLKEIADDAALLVDPADAQSIAQSLGRLLTDMPLRTSLIDKGRKRAADFSWKKTVDMFLAHAGALTNEPR